MRTTLFYTAGKLCHQHPGLGPLFSLRAGVSNAILPSRVVTRTAEVGWAATCCGSCGFDIAAMYGASRRGCTELQSSS